MFLQREKRLLCAGHRMAVIDGEDICIHNRLVPKNN